ncbi:flagellar assembly protein FliW [Halalkalibacter sp. AB-rgal2]|uniref:flagellar assembly protein FliW n=1 Tax=Halalkalibacter sp. AB-rgal2 TaxID=3242695 RepID=UPI00359D0940
MKIKTKYIGEIDVKDEQIITFPTGIPAFDDETSFVLHPFDEQSPFLVLQSTKSVEIAFILVNPFDFVPNYEVKLQESTKEQLNIEKPEEVSTYVLLTVKEPFAETTANLQGPIIINVRTNKAKQILMSDSSYTTKHQIFKQATKAGKGE